MLRLLSLRIFKVGAHYIVQREGAPIGGPIRSQLLDLVLSSIETRFDTKFWPLMARLLDLPVHRRKTIMAFRYADDVFLISPFLCDVCLGRIGSEIYSKYIPFEPALDSLTSGLIRSIKFLDTWTHLTFNSIAFGIFITNESFIWWGGHRKKCRFPCFFVGATELAKKLAADLTGRRARWAQLGLHSFELTYAITVEIAECLCIGIPLVSLRKRGS